MQVRNVRMWDDGAGRRNPTLIVVDGQSKNSVDTSPQKNG